MSIQRRQVFPGFATGLALVVAGAVVTAQERSLSSASRERGRAAVEYRDKEIHIVAAYYYAQQNHDSRWIMIETALSTTARTLIARSAIALRTPDGREIPLSGQREVGEDVTRIQALLQNARTVSHDVVSYFSQRDRVEDMQFFTLPFGDVVHDDFVVDRDRVAVGPLFFASPTGAWERGAYTLVVRHEHGTAELPLRLE